VAAVQVVIIHQEYQVLLTKVLVAARPDQLTPQELLIKAVVQEVQELSS
jgi:hypothetical protein